MCKNSTKRQSLIKSRKHYQSVRPTINREQAALLFAQAVEANLRGDRLSREAFIQELNQVTWRIVANSEQESERELGSTGTHRT